MTNTLPRAQRFMENIGRLESHPWATKICDFICSTLLTIATMALLFSLWGWEVKLFSLCAICLCANLLILFSFEKWFVFPLAILAVGAAQTLMAFTGELPFSQYMRELWAWILGVFPQHEVFTENGSLIMAHWAIALPIGAIFWVFLRYLYSSIALSLVFAGAIILSYYQANDVHTVILFCLALTLIACLPRTFIRRQKAGEGVIYRASLQFIALLCGALCLWLAFAIVPDRESVWQWEYVSHIWADAEDIAAYYEGDADEHAQFSLESTGYMPLGSRLGGDVTLLEKQYFQIRSEVKDPAYFAASYYDTYTGQNWTKEGDANRFRYGSLFWNARFSDVYGKYLPVGNRDVQALYDEITRLDTYKIFNFDVYQNAFLSTGSLRKIWFSNRHIGNNIYFNQQGELFQYMSEKIMSAYETENIVFDRNRADFDEKFKALEQMVSDKTDAQYENILTRYSGTSDNIPADVAQLAQEITKDAKTPYAKARAIESWLAENCTYTLTPGTPPVEEDFVSWFLQTREGYCTYYASAMTVLARSVGLPARYVTGFGVIESGTVDDLYCAYDFTAHAWCQVYFNGIGWVNFDPLTWDYTALYREKVEIEPPSGVIDQAELDEIYAQIPPSASEPITIGSSFLASLKGEGMRSTFNMLLVIGVVAAIFAVISLINRSMMYYINHYGITAVQKRYATQNERVRCYVEDILRQYSYLGAQPAPSDTLQSFLLAQASRRTVYDMSIEQVCDIAQKQIYGGKDATYEELFYLCTYHRQMEEQLKQILGKPAYFFTRVLWRKNISL